jgi:hypothetical protein
MSRTPALFALLGMLTQVPALLAGPPQGPSGRMVQDMVPTLLAEVKRLEKEVAHDKSLAEELDMARARLAAAEGRKMEARSAWRKIVAEYEERLCRAEFLAAKGAGCDPDAITSCRGVVAMVRCELAEVERDRAALTRELPKVIAFREAQLAWLRKLAQTGAVSPDEAEQGEKDLMKEIRQARQRLDAVKRR